MEIFIPSSAKVDKPSSRSPRLEAITGSHVSFQISVKRPAFRIIDLSLPSAEWINSEMLVHTQDVSFVGTRRVDLEAAFHVVMSFQMRWINLFWQLIKWSHEYSCDGWLGKVYFVQNVKMST